VTVDSLRVSLLEARDASFVCKAHTMLRRALCLLLVAILPSHVTLAQPLAQPGSATPGAGPSAGSPASAPADATAVAPAPTAVAKGPAQAPGPAASSTPAPGSTGAAATGKHHIYTSLKFLLLQSL
jgi:hypothetical protein